MTETKVLHYTETTAKIFFAGNDVRCSLCPLMETYARRQCRLTGEYLAEGYLRGGMCPLEIINKEENHEIQDFERIGDRMQS